MSTAPAPARPSARLAYLDNLKAIAIAGIIAGHALIIYSDFGSFAYQEYREVTVSPGVEAAALVVAGPVAVFVIALLFLVSGLLTPASVDRKGSANFVRDRLLRLGLPFAFYALLLWPAIAHPLDVWLGDTRESFWWAIWHQDPLFDTGPLWFLLVLLIFSIGYAGWHAATRRRTRARISGQHVPVVSGSTLALVAVLVVLTTFLIRLVFPWDTPQLAGLHLWQWPECLALFGLGIVTVRQRWLDEVPRPLHKGCGITVLVTSLLAAAFILSADALGVTDEQLAGGWHWASFAFAAIEGTLSVCGSVWLLGSAQRRLTGTGPLRSRAGRAAYAAFLLQGPVLVAGAVALRPLDLPGDVKAVVLAVGGVAICYAVGDLVVRRSPLKRVL